MTNIIITFKLYVRKPQFIFNHTSRFRLPNLTCILISSSQTVEKLPRTYCVINLL